MYVCVKKKKDETDINNYRRVSCEILLKAIN